MHRRRLRSAAGRGPPRRQRRIRASKRTIEAADRLRFLKLRTDTRADGSSARCHEQPPPVRLGSATRSMCVAERAVGFDVLEFDGPSGRRALAIFREESATFGKRSD
jgi:hypothetical protein